MSGRVVTSASSSAARARPNTDGKAAVAISSAPSRGGSRNTASSAGLTPSPPNGSNPVTRAFMGLGSALDDPRIAQRGLVGSNPRAPGSSLSRTAGEGIFGRQDQPGGRELPVLGDTDRPTNWVVPRRL